MQKSGFNTVITKNLGSLFWFNWKWKAELKVYANSTITFGYDLIKTELFCYLCVC